MLTLYEAEEGIAGFANLPLESRESGLSREILTLFGFIRLSAEQSSHILQKNSSNYYTTTSNPHTSFTNV